MTSPNDNETSVEITIEEKIKELESKVNRYEKDIEKYLESIDGKITGSSILLSMANENLSDGFRIFKDVKKEFSKLNMLNECRKNVQENLNVHKERINDSRTVTKEN